MALFGKKPVDDDYEIDEIDEEVVETKLTAELSDEELKDIAIDIYDKYTDNSLKGIRQGYADKDSSALSASRKKTLKDLYKLMSEDSRDFSEEQIKKMIAAIDSRVYKYDILDDLIADPEVSDIKTYSWNNIRIKRLGRRYPAEVSFKNADEYQKFVTRILERNNINFGTANANQTFTDNTQDSAKLRISCISEFLTDSKIPCVAIRKIQKKKRGLDELQNRGMFNKQRRPKEEQIASHEYNLDFIDNEELRRLIPDIVNSKGVLFGGKGASGKTTIMNALAELIPHDESIMIAQENPEMFIDSHPDCLCTHTLVNNGDSKISYGLSALTRMGLLIDLDRIIVGEVKQADEAEGLSKASMTGHKCWTSVHGEDAYMDIRKMADYISHANANFSFADALNQLQGFEYVVHMRDFQIVQILHIKGWDYDKNDLITEEVYRVND